jgi:hypothetical protein
MTCTNTTTDELNCGSCGHSCLGGGCSGGICQPLLLGTVPGATFDFARETIVSGGKVYVFTQVGQGAPSNVWQTDATTPTTPVEVEKSNGIVSCIMNGELFWIAYNGSSPQTIDSCNLSNCAATTTPIVTLSDQWTVVPGCDTATNEIVWVTSSSGVYTIYRASPNGGNSRPLTSFSFPNDGASWSFVDDGQFPRLPDSLFFARNDSVSGNASLYYISTNVVNAANVLLANLPGSQILTGNSQEVLVNDTIVLASRLQPASSTDQVVSAPFPNGILSGVPPLFTAGDIAGGIIDETSFYGTLIDGAVPSDAVVRCPLSACTTPTVLFRGQASATNFADDANAFYWTTSGSQGFSIWKAAK